MDSKQCSKCKKLQPLDQFYRMKQKGYRPGSHCKTCMLDYAHRWYRENPERAKQARKAYYERTRTEYIRACSDRRIKKLYGVENYGAVLASQGGGCAICGKTEAENGKRLHVDHDHATGKTRELLCQSCNHVLGLFHDDAARFEAAARYLKKHG